MHNVELHLHCVASLLSCPYASGGHEDVVVTLLWLHVQGNLQTPQRPNQQALSRQHSMVMPAQMPSLRLSNRLKARGRLSNRLRVMPTLTEEEMAEAAPESASAAAPREPGLQSALGQHAAAALEEGALQ